mgnify:FL=1
MSHKHIVIIAIVVELIFWLGVMACQASEWDEYSDQQIANAIYQAEGGVKTRFPYGVKSIKCQGEPQCRKICLNSVFNGRKRWERAGKPTDLITFIGKRYSPPSTNPNWVRLVTYFLKKGI